MPVVKEAIYDLLVSRTNSPTVPFAITYGSPTDATQPLTDSGAGVAVWWADDTDAEVEVAVLVGGDKWFDETYTLTLVIQGLAKTTDDDQYDIDVRTAQVLGEAIGVLADDPTAAIADTAEYQIHSITPVGGWRYRSGQLNMQRAGHFEYGIVVNARLKLA